MAQLSFLSAIGVGLFILNPLLVPAQEVQYASVSITENIKSKESVKNVALAGKTFADFEWQHQNLATILKEKYAALKDFIFEQRGTLTHTFFSQSGQKMHVIFNKKNGPVLEVTTLIADSYPKLLVNTIRQDYPESEVVTIKHFQSDYGIWYEAVIRENDALKKVEIIL